MDLALVRPTKGPVARSVSEDASALRIVHAVDELAGELCEIFRREPEGSEAARGQGDLDVLLRGAACHRIGRVRGTTGAMPGVSELAEPNVGPRVSFCEVNEEVASERMLRVRVEDDPLDVV